MMPLMCVCGWSVWCGMSDAGDGSLEVSVEAPARASTAGPRSQQLPTAVNQLSDGVHEVQYTPLVTGPHTVNVYYAGQPINHSPFTTHVKPRQYLSLCICLSVCLSVITQPPTPCWSSVKPRQFLSVTRTSFTCTSGAFAVTCTST